MIKHPEKLADVVPDLVRLFEKAAEDRDILIICGFRGEEAQAEAYETGASNAKWPHSEHNRFPSIAVDAAPVPLDWNDLDGFLALRNHLELTAKDMGLELKPIIRFKNYRGKWITDYPHFALKK